MAWKTMGQLDQAIASYRRALQIDPAYTFAHSNLIYSLQMHPAFSAQAIHHEAVRWDQRQAEPVRPLILPHSADPDPDRSLRIGYVSADFRDHVVGRNLMPLLRNHDRQRFQIICYSSVADPDWMTAGLRKHADHWRNICGLSDQELISLIRDDQVDVLVDLSLHTAGNRLRAFAGKPSSVQVTFAGYPGTTGLSAIDYRLSDPYLDPPGMDESVYTERTIRLPHSFWCYDPLECADISVSALPASKTGTITFGCLNSFCKINDGVLALWSQVLRRVPSSRILLLATEGSHRQRTIDRLGQAEIAPGRIEFAAPSPRRKYMELYHRIDIGLDCFPYNGHTTSLDSFWMGVPVVTLVGSTVVGRAGWCHLSNLGLVELAAQTPDQFVQKTAALAQDLPRLEELRLTLRERMQRSPLMDAPKFARDIEAAYRQMWRAWCASPKLKNA
jgi:predicted O-linked N-acetylglucosamine transferase (SPINDLY family)